MRKLKLFFACLLMAVLSIGQMWATDPVDVLTASDLTATNTTYVDFSNVSKNSTAVYAGQSAKTSSGGIQLRSKNSNSGIVSTTSGGVVKSVKITVESGSNTIDIYGSNTAYTAATDLYDSNKQGTKVGSLSATGTITFTDDEYAYVGIRSKSGALYLTNVEITWTSPAPPTYTITAESNNTTYGTVSLSGSVITGSPKPGYRYADPAYSVSPANSATVSQVGDAFTVTPSANTTVTVNFEQIPQYTVTWNNNDVTSTSKVYEGEKPVFPTTTPTSCDATSTTFIGWSTEPWTGKIANLDDKTVYTSASAMPAVTGNGTIYYAVFAKSSGSASNLFEWAGGSSADLTAEGNHVTAQGLGSDYAAGNSPYLVKLDGTGDYIIIDTEAAIGSVEIGVKMIGGANTSSITVQEADSKDAEFTDVETLSISGAQNDVVNLATTNAFASTSRAVKLLFTKGSNVGLGPITIVGAVSMSDYMTTCAAPTCDNLGTPVVNVTNKTYNSARLTWAAVTNAAKYLVKFNGEDQEATDNLYFDAASLDAETQYTYQVKALAEEGQDDWCDGAFSAEANFTTEPAPSATLKLMENGNEVDGGSHTVSVPFALPKEVTHTCGKTFVGWDDDENCDHAPTYAPGANFTFADQTGVTLYAVYANVAAGTTTNIAYTGSTTTNMTGNNDAADLVDATDVTGWSVVGYKGGGSNFPGLNKDGTIRLYYNASGNSYIEVTAPQTIASVALTMGELNNVIVKVGGNTVAISDGVYPIGATSFTVINGNTTNAQAHIQNIAVNFPGAQSNWATTCVDPLENPTFSLDPVVAPVNDKYEEAINVVITNNAGEGTIYYTTNGQNPTSASTEYTGAITLNTCGTKTIKAIVISDNNQSEVVSATYEMAIPIPSVSAEDPYTEAEAIAVIDGGCYNNEDVYVTGTVASNGAAWYPNSGTYTITLENGFKFYYFYEGENEQSFMDNYIAAGDVLVAKGKLEKSGNTYRLAQGCYLVSRTPAQKTPIDSDIDNPITVADALGYIDQAATYDLTNVYVKGVASENPDNQGTFNIHDADVDNTFQIYKGVLSQELIDAGVVVEENDTVIAVGELTKFYSTYEMAQGGNIVVVKKYVAPTVAVTAVDLTESSASVEAGLTVTLHAAVVPDNATDQAIVWSVTSGNDNASVDQNGVVSGLVAGEAVIRAASHEDASIFAECTVTVTPSSIPENTDIITKAKVGLTGTSYQAWGPKSGFGTSSQYAGFSVNGTGTNADAVQLKSKDSNSGIILTSSNGLMLKGLSVTVTSGENTLNVYAKSTAYENVTDLYSSEADVQGTLIGTVSGTGELQLEAGISYDDNYQYIGMRSANGALYLNNITITWGEAYVAPEPVYEEGRAGLTVGNYYTICLPKKVIAFRGASIWDLKKRNTAGSEVYLEEAQLPFAAGTPFIIQATEATLEVVYEGDVTSTPVENGALRGTLTGLDVDAFAGLSGNIYILKENAIRPRTAGNWLSANRAYIDYDALQTVSETPASAPGKRVRAIPMQENTTTGMDELNASETPVKMIIDGQLFIIRGEKMFNANGQLVK